MSHTAVGPAADGRSQRRAFKWVPERAGRRGEGKARPRRQGRRPVEGGGAARRPRPPRGRCRAGARRAARRRHRLDGQARRCPLGRPALSEGVPMKMPSWADRWPSEPVAPTKAGRRRARRHALDRPTEATRAQPSGARSRHSDGDTLAEGRRKWTPSERSSAGRAGSRRRPVHGAAPERRAKAGQEDRRARLEEPRRGAPRKAASQPAAHFGRPSQGQALSAPGVARSSRRKSTAF